MSSKAESETRKKKSVQHSEEHASNFNPAQIKVFAAEVKSEFEKIAWPDKKHTAVSAVVVVVFVSLLSLYLFTVDAVLGSIVKYFLK